MDLATLLIGAAFYVLFAVSIQRYLQHREALELAVVLVFTSTAALFAIGVINGLLPALSPYLGPVAVTLLVAQPALMVRLVGLITPLPRWAGPLAVIGFVIAVTGYYLAARSVPAILFLVGYFALTELLAALALLAEARRRVGFPRVRLATAGVASILFGASILVSGAAAAARGGGAGTSDPAIIALSRFLALVAGLGYLAAFVPPRWLRDIVHRALAFDLVRSIVASPTGTEPRVLWGALARTASTILGTSDVRITRDDEVLATDGDGTAPADPTLAAWHASAPAGGRPSVAIDLVTEGRPIATLTAVLAGRPLFLEDDVELLELLGSLTARAVEREEAVARLTDATRALDEAGAVRASEARFRALLDAEPNAILSVDANGTIRWCTRTAATMFRTTEDSLVGRQLDDVVPPGNEARSPASSEAGVDRYETIGTRADGATFPAEVALSALELDGEPAQLAVIADVTWRQDADEIRDRFIGVLSHELRTPDHLDLRWQPGPAPSRRPARPADARCAARGRRRRVRATPADDREPADPRPRRARRGGRRRRPRPHAPDPARRRRTRAGQLAVHDDHERRGARAAAGGRRRGVAAEAVLGHRAAHAARDPLGAERDLVPVLLLAALLGSVRVADRHSNDGDGVVDTGHRRHARYAPSGPDDHLAVDRLAEQPVRAAHVVLALGCDRGGLEAEARVAHGGSGLGHHIVVRLTAVVEGEVEVLEARARPSGPRDRGPAAPARAAPARFRLPRGR